MTASRTPSDPRAMGAALRGAGLADLQAVIGLLSGAGLPTAGVAAALEGFVIAVARGEIVGVAGLEPYGRAGLLRSVVVSPDARNGGVGAALIDRVLADAGGRGINDLFLLTTTAESYFARRGFSRIDREAVPEPVQASVEFQGVCPTTAVVMHRRLRSESAS